MPGPVLPESAWGTQLLCCVALCLLWTGPVGAGVIQTPRHLIKGSGGKALLECHLVSGHNTVRWYKQAPGQGPQFLFEYYRQEQRDKGDVPARFSAQQFSDASSLLEMNPLEAGDSALYLCASSLAQPCGVTGFLYSNFPVPAEDIRGRGGGVLSQVPGMHLVSFLTLCLAELSQSTPEHVGPRFTEYSRNP
ncbi:T cell receptor beta variable 13 [Vulpes lagopus]